VEFVYPGHCVKVKVKIMAVKKAKSACGAAIAKRQSFFLLVVALWVA